MLKYIDGHLFIIGSDTQDRLAVSCTREQLENAINILNTGINEENNSLNIADPENRWKAVVEYNEKIGYKSIVTNKEDVLQIAKVEIVDNIAIIILKHLGKGKNMQCNFTTTERKFIDEFSKLSTYVRVIPSFISRVYTVSNNIKLLPNLDKVGTNCYILPGDGFVLLYRAEYSIVTNLMRIPTVVFTEYKDTIEDLQFTIMSVPPKRINTDILEKHIWRVHERTGESLKTLCQQYSGNDFIVKLYETDEETVYCYKTQEPYRKSVRFEVVNYRDQNNSNSCTLPWNVYVSICDTLRR